MKKEKLIQEIEEKLLSFSDEQEEVTRSDFQGRAYVVALEIIKLVKNAKAEAEADAIKTLEELQDNDILINRGDIIQDLQDIIELINNN